MFVNILGIHSSFPLVFLSFFSADRALQLSTSLLDTCGVLVSPIPGSIPVGGRSDGAVMQERSCTVLSAHVKLHQVIKIIPELFTIYGIRRGVLIVFKRVKFPLETLFSSV